MPASMVVAPHRFRSGDRDLDSHRCRSHGFGGMPVSGLAGAPVRVARHEGSRAAGPDSPPVGNVDARTINRAECGASVWRLGAFRFGRPSAGDRLEHLAQPVAITLTQRSHQRPVIRTEAAARVRRGRRQPRRPVRWRRQASIVLSAGSPTRWSSRSGRSSPWRPETTPRTDRTVPQRSSTERPGAATSIVPSKERWAASREATGSVPGWRCVNTRRSTAARAACRPTSSALLR